MAASTTTGTTGGPKSRYRDALARRDFRLLIASLGVDQIGGWAGSVVLLVYIYDRTGSAGALAATSTARYVPMILLSGYAGVLADRYDRARLLRASALASLGVASAMTAVVAADGPVVLLVGLSALLAVTVLPYAPAAGALTADAVPERDLAAANAVYSLVENLGVVLGPLVGALALGAGTPVVGFGLNAVTFALAAVIVSGVRTRSRGDAGAAGEGLLRQLTDGARTLAADPVARILTLFMLLTSAVFGTTTVLYVAFSDAVGGGGGGYGYLLAGQAAGGVLCAGLTNRLAARPSLTPVIVVGSLVMVAPVAGLAALDTLPVGAVLQAGMGAGMVVLDVLALTALQRSLPRERLSRVLGLINGAVVAAILLGSVLAGTLIELVGVDAAALTVGALGVLITLAGARPLARAEAAAAAGALARLGERVDALHGLDLFTDAGRPALERLALGIREETVEPGHVLLRQGDPADALWVVRSGHFTVTVDGVTTNEVTAGEYAGEIGLLHARPRTATVTATAPSLVWRVDGEDFTAVLGGGGASASLRGVAESRLARR